MSRGRPSGGGPRRTEILPREAHEHAVREGRVVVVGGLGQRSVLSFAQWQGNVAIKPERFRFQPPAGADVIRP